MKRMSEPCKQYYFETSLFYRQKLLTGKKQRQIKLQRLQKVRMWAFGLLAHQINSLYEVFKLKQNFQKK